MDSIQKNNFWNLKYFDNDRDSYFLFLSERLNLLFIFKISLGDAHSTPQEKNTWAQNIS